jgi:DNA polymerase-3 subunit epsilon
MVAIADRIDHIACPTSLEANIREIRMISEKQPRYNRRSRFQEKVTWIKLTEETFPRLSIVRSSQDLSDENGWCGPFGGSTSAQFALEAIHEVSKLRQCTPRITTRSQKTASPCALYDMGKCGAPCISAEDEFSYLEHVSMAKSIMHENSSLVESALAARMEKLADDERFEEASEFRDRFHAFIHGISRGHRIRSLTKLPRLLVAKKIENGWEFVHIKYGRLVGSASLRDGEKHSDVINALKLSSEVLHESDRILPHSTYEEVERLLAYIEEGVRIVEIEGDWVMPIFGPSKAYAIKRQQDATQDI